MTVMLFLVMVAVVEVVAEEMILSIYQVLAELAVVELIL